jgi:hypothetical protein
VVSWYRPEARAGAASPSVLKLGARSLVLIILRSTAKYQRAVEGPYDKSQREMATREARRGRRQQGTSATTTCSGKKGGKRQQTEVVGDGGAQGVGLFCVCPSSCSQRHRLDRAADRKQAGTPVGFDFPSPTSLSIIH